MEVKECICCNGVDKTGLINGMCTDCYDLSLDIGKTDTKEKLQKKRDLENRRINNGYYGGVRA
jgi:hypothetical protein